MLLPDRRHAQAVHSDRHESVHTSPAGTTEAPEAAEGVHGQVADQPVGDQVKWLLLLHSAICGLRGEGDLQSGVRPEPRLHHERFLSTGVLQTVRRQRPTSAPLQEHPFVGARLAGPPTKQIGAQLVVRQSAAHRQLPKGARVLSADLSDL